MKWVRNVSRLPPRRVGIAQNLRPTRRSEELQQGEVYFLVTQQVRVTKGPRSRKNSRQFSQFLSERLTECEANYLLCTRFRLEMPTMFVHPREGHVLIVPGAYKCSFRSAKLSRSVEGTCCRSRRRGVTLPSVQYDDAALAGFACFFLVDLSRTVHLVSDQDGGSLHQGIHNTHCPSSGFPLACVRPPSIVPLPSGSCPH